MSSVVTYSNMKPGGTFAQIKLNDGSRVLISVTQDEVAILKLILFGNIPTKKIWANNTKELLETTGAYPDTLLDGLVGIVEEAVSIDEIPALMDRSVRESAKAARRVTEESTEL